MSREARFALVVLVVVFFGLVWASAERSTDTRRDVCVRDLMAGHVEAKSAIELCLQLYPRKP